MKFISGIRELKDSKIKIPFYHRASIGFIPGTSVYFIYSNLKDKIGSGPRELILTTILPIDWTFFRKITINALEKKGVIHKIAQTLRAEGINIHTQEAITTEPDQVHSVSIIADLRRYKQHNTAENSEEILHDKLCRMTIDDEFIVGTPAHQNVQITKLDFLYENAAKISDEQREHDYASQTLTISGEEIDLDEKDKIIKDNLQLEYNNGIHYIMFSDTEEKYIKILFINPDQKIAYIDIRHTDQLGAIADFTEIILKHHYNILASYNRQQMSRESAHWYALIDISANPTAFFKDTLQDLSGTRHTKNVFLIESNFTGISDTTVLKFGKNKKSKNYEGTSIYKRKRRLIYEQLKKGQITDDSITSVTQFIFQHQTELTTVSDPRGDGRLILEDQQQLIKHIINHIKLKKSAEDLDKDEPADEYADLKRSLEESNLEKQKLQETIRGLEIKITEYQRKLSIADNSAKKGHIIGIIGIVVAVIIGIITIVQNMPNFRLK